MSPRKIGRPLPKATAADAHVTPTDVALARDAWKRDAPPAYRRLLNAKLKAEPEQDG